MNIILFGFKGCGKTHFGERLAAQLHKPFIDTDHLIIELYAQRTGDHRSIREIHQTLGDLSFRSLESDAIHLLENISDSVIALGGGVALNPDHIDFLQTIGQLIYLEASFDTIQKRVFSQGIPSFVDPKNPIESLRTIYHDRKPIYESIPARRINTDQLDEAGVLAAIISIVYREETTNGI